MFGKNPERIEVNLNEKETPKEKTPEKETNEKQENGDNDFWEPKKENKDGFIEPLGPLIDKKKKILDVDLENVDLEKETTEINNGEEEDENDIDIEFK